MKFGRLTVESIDPVRKGVRKTVYWVCRCECGNIKSISSGCLGTNTESCGCLHKERTSLANTKHGFLQGRRGDQPRIYKIWCGMVKRCKDLKNRNYGGRGIRVCKRWEKFQNFHADMSPQYQNHLSIDRIDNDGNYEPGNCRWANQKMQGRNSRGCRIFEWKGITKCLTEWCEEFNLPVNTVWYRINSGWTFEKAMTKPIGTNYSGRFKKHQAKNLEPKLA